MNSFLILFYLCVTELFGILWVADTKQRAHQALRVTNRIEISKKKNLTIKSFWYYKLTMQTK